MDTFTFISSVVKSLAWPVTAVTVAVLFRNRIENVFARMIELKVKGFSVKLDGAAELLQRAERELRPKSVVIPIAEERQIAPPLAHGRASIEKVYRPELREVAPSSTGANGASQEADPGVQFETDWQLLKTALLQKAYKGGAKRLQKADSAVAYLIEHRLLVPEFQKPFAYVLSVHNLARRNPVGPIDPDLARSFSQICRQLMEYLD